MLAATTTTNSSGSGVGFVFVAIIVIILFALFRRRAQSRMGVNTPRESAAVIGSEVMTGSGLYGTVVGQDDEQVLLEIAPGVQVRFAKAAIARVISSDEFSSDEFGSDLEVTGDLDSGHGDLGHDAGAEVPIEPPQDPPADHPPHPQAGPPDDSEDRPGDTAR